MLREITYETQVQTIISILRAGVALPDSRIWRMEGPGIYTVKSGYKLLTKENPELQKDLATPQSNDEKKFFSLLWALQLPEKINITLENLQQLHVYL